MKRYVIAVLLFISNYPARSQNLDLRLLNYINGPASPADATWRDISRTIDVVGVAAPASMLIVGLATNNKDLTTNGLQTAGSIIIAQGMTMVLKNTIKRQRPYLAYPDIITGKSNSTEYSFPSGHTSVAFATATSLSLAYPKWYVIVPSFTYAATIGYSRSYLGVHYPSDVLAGAVLGAGSAFLTFKLQKLITKKHTTTP